MSDSAKARTHEQTVSLNRLGRKWLLSFFSALRTSQFHKSDNQIFDEPVAQLTNIGNEILTIEGKCDFRIFEDQFFLNGLWIKPTLSEKDQLFLLVDTMKEFGMGGVMVRSNTFGTEWRTFLTLYRSVFAPAVEKVGQLNRELAKAGIEQISVSKWMPISMETERRLPLPLASFVAVLTYGKALTALHDFALAEPGEEQVTALRKAQRVVCELVEIVEKNPRLFAVLSLLKNFDTFFFHHGVNVCLLSIMLGKTLGLGRKELADLGMAALLHDVGKLRVPETILNKNAQLTEQEWRQIRMHPVESARTFLTLGYLNDSVAERILVAFQHHWASRLPNAYPQPRRTMTPSFMSQIVTIAVSFDALTSEKPYRGCFTPYQGIRILTQEAERGRYRKELIQMFVRLMGPVPIGTWIKFEDGREGLVASSGVWSLNPPFPLVFISNGDGGEWVNSATPLASGKRPQISAKRAPTDRYPYALSGLFKLGEGSLF